MKQWSTLIIWFFLAFIASCGKESKKSSEAPSVANPYTYSFSGQYFKKSQRIVIEVYYEPGAEPFVGDTVGGRTYWSILEDNLTAVFQYRTLKPVIIVPKALSGMKVIPSQNKTTWTPTEVLKLNTTYKESDSTSTESRFYIYFLKGNLSNGPSTIGASLNGTPVLAVFKDVVVSSGNSIVQRYVEQSTLVHEMGHALGFVNNGVPMKAPYQDSSHGNHSTNSNCVMYWLNEGSADLVSFVMSYIASGNAVMWGPEVLADAQAFSE